jgi:hypothetical protein
MKNSLAALITAILLLTSCATSKKKNDQSQASLIHMEVIRDLTLAKPIEPGRKAHVSAASGITKVGDRFYVVSDDELTLFTFTNSDQHLSPVQLIKGQLPFDTSKRKAEKPDFESLALLSDSDWEPYGALVTWPSASTPKRTQAVIIPFDKNKKLSTPVISNILPLAYELQSTTKELNMEGILFRDKKVFLFQRGNSEKGKNGFAEISLKNWIAGMKSGNWSEKIQFESVKMGQLSGVDITFSDVIWTKYGLLALGSAEDTTSSFADGQIYGTVLARIVGDKAEIIGKFDPLAKLEGVYASETADGLELYLVEDADDPAKASRLFKANISASQLNTINKP